MYRDPYSGDGVDGGFNPFLTHHPGTMYAGGDSAYDIQSAVQPHLMGGSLSNLLRPRPSMMPSAGNPFLAPSPVGPSPMQQPSFPLGPMASDYQSLFMAPRPQRNSIVPYF